MDSWILEWIVKILEGLELHPEVNEKLELLSALRFSNSDKNPPPYIIIWTKLIADWPSIVNGGYRFLLQAT